VKIAMIGQKGIPATYGGVERHVEELAAQLVRMGHEVTVYCRKHYTSEKTTHRGITLKILPSIHTKHLDALSHSMAAVADAVRSSFDVIHFHAVGPASLTWVPRLFWKKKLAVVATVHSADWRRRKWGVFAKACLRAGAWAAMRCAHRTIAVSQEMTDYFAARGGEVAHIPNGVERAERQAIRELARFGVKEKKYILWIGRFVPEKRVEDLVTAFRSCRTDHTLLLAGETDPSDTYFRRVEDATEGDPRIIFTGGLYGRAKAEAFSHAALVVQPSELEGFPIALLEAMRYGRPVLASDIPAHLEAVTPGRNGFIYKMGDVDALKRNLTWALAHARETEQAGRRAESDTRSYDWTKIAQSTETIYQEAVSRARPRHRK